MEALFKSADDLAEKAVNWESYFYFQVLNAMRQSAKEKEGELTSMEEEIK